MPFILLATRQGLVTEHSTDPVGATLAELILVGVIPDLAVVAQATVIPAERKLGGRQLGLGLLKDLCEFSLE